MQTAPESSADSRNVINGLITRAELLGQLGIKHRALLNWEKQGLPVIRCGNIRYYEPAAVRSWILSRRSGTPAAPRRGRPRKAATER